MAQVDQPPRRVQDPHKVFRQRVKAGLEQKDLAAKVGISAAQMSRIETGNAGSSVEVLHRLAKVFGCEVTELMPAEPETSST